MRRFPGLLSFALVLLGLSASAWAGPPLVCHPLDIDGARSLPFGDGAYDTVASYDRDELTRDTLALLTQDMPVLVRMETLRRAVIYAGTDGAAKTVRSQELLGALMRRVLDAQASGKDDPLAWFDAGYAIETFKQTGYFSKWGNSPSFDLTKGTMREWDGAAWVAHALAVRGKDPEMQFAMALIQAMRDRMSQNENLRSAVDGRYRRLAPGQESVAPLRPRRGVDDGRASREAVNPCWRRWPSHSNGLPSATSGGA